MTAASSLAPSAPRIPLWLKLAFTAFMAVMVPVYLYYYGWTNFLYFCDIAMILTLIGVQYGYGWLDPVASVVVAAFIGYACWEIFRSTSGILSDRSSAVWRGMIKVDPGAQRTDAFQESRNLLLSKRAHADAIPGLEILADDVRCTHAAAIAQIDREQLFYLRSHGLSEADAQRLVIEGFLQALVERFEEGPVREAVGAALERRLEAVLGA